MSEAEILIPVEDINISNFNIDIKMTNEKWLVIGLGAVGSAFMTFLMMFLRDKSNIDIFFSDFDHIEKENLSVSAYGFVTPFIGMPTLGEYKSEYIRKIIKFSNGFTSFYRSNNVNFYEYTVQVNQKWLYNMFKAQNKFNKIFIFADNNQLRFDVYSFFHFYKHSIEIYDVRIGSYNEYELIYTNDLEMYKKTLYIDDDGKPEVIITNNVCLQDRMSYSIAFQSANHCINLLTEHSRSIERKPIHFMKGRDYNGLIKYK